MLLVSGPSSNRFLAGHLLLGFQLRQVQVPVLIADNSLGVLLQLLLGLRIQTSLHELDKAHKHRLVRYTFTEGQQEARLVSPPSFDAAPSQLTSPNIDSSLEANANPTVRTGLFY